jgi:uncharacterized protein (TIGR03083 family)
VSNLEWMADGTTLFLATLDGVDDEHLDRPTGLPGWTGKHLVAHVHYNALALCRLASWAATGVENRMYESVEQRAREIEQGAMLPTTDRRAFVRASADELTGALADLSPEAWRNNVVTAQGRTVPAIEIPWMRVREAYVHAIDLGGAASFEDLPDDVLAALLKDVVAKRSRAGEGAALAAWLTGRSDERPRLGAWL